ncbi:MAG TPA: stage III sporulation protein AF [Clostridia bacterium]|nr:stage III sporulation protein AF [Clostridia bacterium]
MEQRVDLMDWAKDWVRTISAVLFFSVVAEMLMPEGDMKKYAKLVLGVFVVIAIIDPVVRLAGGRLLLPLPAAPLGGPLEDYGWRVQAGEYEKQSTELISRVVEEGLKIRLSSIQGLGEASVKVSVARDDRTGRWKVDRVFVTVPIGTGAAGEGGPEGRTDHTDATSKTDGSQSRIEVRVPPIVAKDEDAPIEGVEGKTALPDARGERIGDAHSRDGEKGKAEDESLRQTILTVIGEAVGVSPENVEIRMGDVGANG